MFYVYFAEFSWPGGSEVVIGSSSKVVIHLSAVISSWERDQGVLKYWVRTFWGPEFWKCSALFI